LECAQANKALSTAQRNKETEWNSQPLSKPILFQIESQKPGQKAFKKKNIIFTFLAILKVLKM
jgi:hypothetical protein